MPGKTHKGLKKRTKRTGTGKVIHYPSGRRHAMSKKSAKRRRGLRKPRAFSKDDLKRLERQYGSL